MEEKLKVKSVTEEEGGYGISTEEGTYFTVEKKYGFIPKEGDEITLYTVKGSTIRGMDLNGERKYYKSDMELEKEHAEWVAENKIQKEKEFAENKSKFDAYYESYPDVFKRRIDKFRTNNPNFRVDFESYEMFCCNQALLIAAGLSNEQKISKIPECTELIMRTIPERFDLWDKLKTEDKIKLVPEFDSVNHSGNTYGITMKLAYFYLTEPENVVKMHGALAPMVGSEEYGCIPPGSQPEEPVEEQTT